MAGHSQFANIKHRKNRQDAEKAQKYAKYIREIVVALKSGLADPEVNSKLRTALYRARKEGVPKDKIDKALKSSSHETAENYDEVTYEAYGPVNVAFVLQALTNNRNRTAAELRHTLSKYNGTLAETGSVTFQFKHLGVLIYEKNISFDNLLEFAIEIGAEEVEEKEKEFHIYTKLADFANIQEQLYHKFGQPSAARLCWYASDKITLSEEKTELINRLIEALEDNEDIQYIDSNINT